MTLDHQESQAAAAPAAGSWTAARVGVAVAAALAVIRAAIHVRACWTSDAGIDHPAGVMIAMATDLTHGVFYRPLFGFEGYGGTRYFPLYFVLHASLLKLHVPILAAAYLLSLGAALALLLGMVCLLVRLGVEKWFAAAITGTLLASVSAQYAIVSPHADGLASALNVWGLATIVRPNLSGRRIMVAAVLFVLAWSAKLTMGFGLIVAVLWLAHTGLKRRAVQLAAATTAGYALIAVLVIGCSEGRIIRIFAACALPATGWKRFLEGPAFMVWNVLPGDLTILLLAFAAVTLLTGELLESPAKCLKQLPALLFIATLIVTACIYGSPGTSGNHLLDLQIAALVLLGWMASQSARLQKQLGTYALLLASLLPMGMATIRGHLRQSASPPIMTSGSRFQKVVDLARNSGKPVLAENPIIPILAGQSPYVLDPWMFTILQTQYPGFAQPLLECLRSRAFGLVVLVQNPETAYGRGWYATTHFGPGFTSALKDNYRLLSVIDGQFVYVPIGDSRPQSTALFTPRMTSPRCPATPDRQTARADQTCNHLTPHQTRGREERAFVPVDETVVRTISNKKRGLQKQDGHRKQFRCAGHDLCWST